MFWFDGLGGFFEKIVQIWNSEVFVKGCAGVLVQVCKLALEELFITNMARNMPYVFTLVNEIDKFTYKVAFKGIHGFMWFDFFSKPQTKPILIDFTCLKSNQTKPNRSVLIRSDSVLMNHPWVSLQTILDLRVIINT